MRNRIKFSIHNVVRLHEHERKRNDHRKDYGNEQRVLNFFIMN